MKEIFGNFKKTLLPTKNQKILKPELLVRFGIRTHKIN